MNISTTFGFIQTNRFPRLLYVIRFLISNQTKTNLIKKLQEANIYRFINRLKFSLSREVFEVKLTRMARCKNRIFTVVFQRFVQF